MQFTSAGFYLYQFLPLPVFSFTSFNLCQFLSLLSWTVHEQSNRMTSKSETLHYLQSSDLLYRFITTLGDLSLELAVDLPWLDDLQLCSHICLVFGQRFFAMTCFVVLRAIFRFFDVCLFCSKLNILLCVLWYCHILHSLPMIVLKVLIKIWSCNDVNTVGVCC